MTPIFAITVIALTCGVLLIAITRARDTAWLFSILVITLICVVSLVALMPYGLLFLGACALFLLGWRFLVVGSR